MDIAWLVVCYLDPTLHLDTFTETTTAPALLARYPLQTGLLVNEGIFRLWLPTFPLGLFFTPAYLQSSVRKGRLEFTGPRREASVQILTPPIWLGTHTGPVAATIFIKLGLFGTDDSNQANILSAPDSLLLMPPRLSLLVHLAVPSLCSSLWLLVQPSFPPSRALFHLPQDFGITLGENNLVIHAGSAHLLHWNNVYRVEGPGGFDNCQFETLVSLRTQV